MEYHFQNFYVTRLREALDASSTTIYVDNPPTITSGVLVLEGKNVSKREIIYFSSVSGYALNDCVRGLEGTTPNTHNQGATIEQAVTAGQLDQVLSPHVLLQGLGNDENAAMSQDAVTRVITKSHNTDGTLKDGAVKAQNINFAMWKVASTTGVVPNGVALFKITGSATFAAWTWESICLAGSSSKVGSTYVTRNGMLAGNAVNAEETLSSSDTTVFRLSSGEATTNAVFTATFQKIFGNSWNVIYQVGCVGSASAYTGRSTFSTNNGNIGALGRPCIVEVLTS